MILGVALHRASDQKFSNAKNGDACKKRGGRQGQKRENGEEIVFNFCRTRHGGCRGTAPTPAPVAMFE